MIIIISLTITDQSFVRGIKFEREIRSLCLAYDNLINRQLTREPVQNATPCLTADSN